VEPCFSPPWKKGDRKAGSEVAYLDWLAGANGRSSGPPGRETVSATPKVGRTSSSRLVVEAVWPRTGRNGPVTHMRSTAQRWSGAPVVLLVRQRHYPWRRTEDEGRGDRGRRPDSCSLDPSPLLGAHRALEVAGNYRKGRIRDRRSGHLDDRLRRVVRGHRVMGPADWPLFGGARAGKTVRARSSSSAAVPGTRATWCRSTRSGKTALPTW